MPSADPQPAPQNNDKIRKGFQALISSQKFKKRHVCPAQPSHKGEYGPLLAEVDKESLRCLAQLLLNCRNLKVSPLKDIAMGGTGCPSQGIQTSPLMKICKQDWGVNGTLCSHRRHSIYLIGLCRGRENVHFPNFASIINQNRFYISLNIKLLAPGGSSSSYSKTSVSSFRIDVL